MGRARITKSVQLRRDGQWKSDLMAERPTNFHPNVQGINPDGKPDAAPVYGDASRGGMLDRMSPSSLADCREHQRGAARRISSILNVETFQY